MTAEELENEAIAADRLRNDPAFQRAVLAIRKTVVDAYIANDPNDVQKAVDLRAKIYAIDALSGDIATAILRKPRETKTVA